MKQIQIILGLILFASVTTFAQSPRIKLNQITKDTVKGSVLISSPSDSGMVYSRDFYIAYGADTLLILYGDTIGGVGGGVNSIVVDTITLNGNGTTASPLSVDTATISTIQGLVDSLANYVNRVELNDSLTNYVLKGVADTITSEITFTDTIVLQTYDEGTVSVSSDGRVKTEPTIQTLSLGEGYADVAKEYHITDGKTVYPNSLGYMYAELLRLNLLSKASLILTPTAIETGIVASQKPLSSDGDFTFSRSTSATRVNENGYIEKETQNLLLQSNTFDTTWVNTNTSVTGGKTGYDGSSDAWLLDITGGTATQRISQSISLTGVQTFSIYAKAGTLNWLLLLSIGGDNPEVYFDLQNGVIGNTSDEIDSEIVSVGGGWYRCSITHTDSTTQVRIYLASGNGNVTQSSGNIYIQDAQLEQGLVARDYIETTTSAVYAGVTDNVPRIDYTDKTPSLLLEPQRTNLLAYSEYFEGSGWNKVNAGTGSSPVISTNTNDTTSPEGKYNATKIVFDVGSGTTSGDQSLLEGVVLLAANTEASTSIWLKGENGGEQLHMRGVANGAFQIITLTTEWQQFTTIENSSTTTDFLQFGIRQNVSGLGIINSSATIYAYGAQIEEGSYPTSYIPTYGTSVTRNADVNLNTNISNLIGQTEGTIFIKTNDTKLYTDISDSTSSNRIVLYTDSSGYIRNLIVSGGTTSSEIQTSTTIAKGDKIAMAYKGNDVVIYKNGLQIGSDTSVTVPSTKQINVGTNYASAISDVTDVNNYLLFKTRLSNTELAELTKQ